MVALNWLGRRYEIYTPKSLGRERSNSLALSVVSNFRRSLGVGSPRNFTSARVCISPAPQIAVAKIRDYSQSMFKSVPGCIEGIQGHYGMFRGIMGCSRGVPGLFRAVPGVFRGCSGVFRGCSGVFRAVPGLFRGCSGFYRHPFPPECFTERNENRA